MKKMWALLISACILAGGVAGCGSQVEPQGTVTQKVAEAPAKQDFKAVTTVKSGQKNVYAVVKAMNGNYWKKVIAGMKKAGEENGVNVYVGGVNKDGNWELQRAMLIDAQANQELEALLDKDNDNLLQPFSVDEKTELTSVMAKEMQSAREIERIQGDIRRQEDLALQALEKTEEGLALKVAERVAGLEAELQAQTASHAGSDGSASGEK